MGFVSSQMSGFGEGVWCDTTWFNPTWDNPVDLFKRADETFGTVLALQIHRYCCCRFRTELQADIDLSTYAVEELSGRCFLLLEVRKRAVSNVSCLPHRRRHRPITLLTWTAILEEHEWWECTLCCYRGKSPLTRSCSWRQCSCGTVVFRPF